jgi:TRAP-type C4-dicarboxylate transport system permease small subunit
VEFLLKLLEKIERSLATVSGFIIGIMMFLVTLDVGSRFIFGPSVPGVFEAVELLMVSVVFFAIPYCEGQGSHIRMTMVKDRLNRFGRLVAEILAAACGLAASSLICWGAGKYTIEAFMGHYKAGPLAPISIWPFVASISLGSFLLGVRFLVNCIAQIVKFKD